MLIVRQGPAGDAMMSVIGRFDAYEVAAIRGALRAAIDRAAAGSTVRLDLSATNFFDSRALVELVDARAAGKHRGVAVHLEGASASVRAVMRMARVTPALVAATVDEALMPAGPADPPPHTQRRSEPCWRPRRRRR